VTPTGSDFICFGPANYINKFLSASGKRAREAPARGDIAESMVYNGWFEQTDKLISLGIKDGVCVVERFVINGLN
jgi:hypothetical protein